MSKQIKWEALNAYIDGELSSSDAAEIARAVMRNPDLAAQVARLSTLKAVLGDLRPRHRPSIHLAEAGRRSRWYSRVASLAIFFLLGALLGGVILTNEQAISDNEIARVEAIHHRWLDSPSQVENQALDDLLQVSIETLRLDAYVPDLSSVNLAYDGIRKISINGGEGLHVGFLGPHGCKVSLVISNKPENLNRHLERVDRSDRTVYGWRAGDTGFYLLASHMDPNRLSEIAKVVHRMTRSRLPLDTHAILALNRAKASSQPCTA